MDGDPLVRDYLRRLETAAAALPAHGRAELAAEVREHIETALAEAGRADEVTVRNVLERLGSPEEIVAAEARQTGEASGSAVAGAAQPTVARSGWGAVEVAALIVLTLAWPALFLPFGLILWPAFGFVGLVLAWSSRVWSRLWKLIVTGIVVGLYVLVFAALFVAFTPGVGPPPVDEPAILEEQKPSPLL